MKLSPKRFAVTLLLGFLTGIPGVASAQVFYTEEGDVEFTSEVPLHSFTGTSNHLTGKISLPDSTVDFYLDLTTLDTGNGKRDKDMRETLETEIYPFGEFFGKLTSDFDTTSFAPQEARVRGEFKIHGVSKTVTIAGTLQQTPAGLKLGAAWTLNLTDYNIKPPGILFYRVSEEVEIKIDALLKVNE